MLPMMPRLFAVSSTYHRKLPITLDWTFLLLFSAKTAPFSIQFIADEYEGVIANNENLASAGFKLRYFQTAC